MKKEKSFSLNGLPPQIHESTPLFLDFPMLMFCKVAVPLISPLIRVYNEPLVRSACLLIELLYSPPSL